MSDDDYVVALAEHLKEQPKTEAKGRRLLRCGQPLRTVYCRNRTATVVRQRCELWYCPHCNPRKRHEKRAEYAPLALGAARMIEEAYPDLRHQFWLVTPTVRIWDDPVLDLALRQKILKRALDLFLKSTYLPDKPHRKRSQDQLPTAFVVYGWHARARGCHPHLLVYGPKIDTPVLRRHWQDACHRAHHEVLGLEGNFRFPKVFQVKPLTDRLPRDESVGWIIRYLMEDFRKMKRALEPSEIAAIIDALHGQRMITYRGLKPFKHFMPEPADSRRMVCQCCGETVT